jgi:hypothetical protein
MTHPPPTAPSATGAMDAATEGVIMAMGSMIRAAAATMCGPTTLRGALRDGGTQAVCLHPLHATTAGVFVYTGCEDCVVCIDRVLLDVPLYSNKRAGGILQVCLHPLPATTAGRSTLVASSAWTALAFLVVWSAVEQG